MKRALILLVACSSPKPDPWLTDEPAAYERASATHRDVLIDFTASWSVPSIETSRVLDKLRPALDKRYVALRLPAETASGVVVVGADGKIKKRITAALDETTARKELLP